VRPWRRPSEPTLYARFYSTDESNAPRNVLRRRITNGFELVLTPAAWAMSLGDPWIAAMPLRTQSTGGIGVKIKGDTDGRKMAEA